MGDLVRFPHPKGCRRTHVEKAGETGTTAALPGVCGEGSRMAFEAHCEAWRMHDETNAMSDTRAAWGYMRTSSGPRGSRPRDENRFGHHLEARCLAYISAVSWQLRLYFATKCKHSSYEKAPLRTRACHLRMICGC